LELKQKQQFISSYTVLHTNHVTNVKLPSGLTCARCVLQWWYKTGNNWGCDAEGCGMGRGDKQEVFVNCSDVSIE